MRIFCSITTVAAVGVLSGLFFPTQIRACGPGDFVPERPALVVDSCPNPIVIANITIVNTFCGLSTGSILINLVGGNNGHTFDWDPDISSTNSAAGLPASAYEITITSTSNPACSLDTTVVVDNLNGPPVDIVEVKPSNCLASNGKVTLSPTSLFYVWDNGEVGAVNDGLLSICYYVTATDPGSGCYNILEICVPNENPLESTVEVVKNAKCGRGTGVAEVTVTGGSGVYSYSLGSSSTLTGLTAGDYTALIVDNVSGCMDNVSFSILDLSVTGSVEITPYNILCPGGSNGFVDFAVTPGANFDLPLTFFIRDTFGTQFTPDNLVTGKYYLFIADADSCFLPTDSFFITEPPPIVTQALILPETCDQEGQILLSFSGGNGGYGVDWLDLPGSDNTEDRVNLTAGIYRAVVYDTLFCKDTLDAFVVPSLCARRDTVPLIVSVNATDSLCVAIPIGIPAAAVDFTLVGAGASGVSAHGSWTLSANGCLYYTAGPSPGFAVDTICIAVDIGLMSLTDTTCVIVTITAQPPTEETVFFTVQADHAIAACGTVPPVFNDPVVLQLDLPGLSGTSDAFGTYTINPVSACLTFFAYALPSFNVDTITVAVCDTALERCHLIHYIPTVLPVTNCSGGFVPGDTLTALTTDCAAGDVVCVPIPYGDIVNFVMLDNGLPYMGGYLGCDLDTLIAYSTLQLPPNGPYQLNDWTINGQSFSGAFQDVSGLLALMNQIDPTPGWVYQNNMLIVGGNSANTYDPIYVTSSLGVTGVLDGVFQFDPQGTELRFSAGVHEVVLRQNQTGCADTMTVNIVCVDCPPIHNYPVDMWGYVEWDAPECYLDTLFCTNILTAELDNYVITDNGVDLDSFEHCGNLVGMRFDTGYHEIRIRDLVSTCEYVVIFYLDCPNIIIDDVITVQLTVGESETVCPNQDLLNPPIISIVNICDDDNGNVSYTLDQQTFCAELTGAVPGEDTLCLQICNGDGDCVTTGVLVIVSAAPQDTVTQANPDQIATVKNTPVVITLLANDIVENALGNLAGLAEFVIVTQPQLGQAVYDPGTGTVTYTPADDTCGADFFIYQITDSRGVSSTARVDVTIVCDELLIFNGFSPNGDNVNDAWRILGIDDYPGNTVQVFNRWGNLVFEQTGYTNQNAWDGRWNGKDLPDGTYYYLIDLGDNKKPLSGYLQLMR